LSVVAVSGAFVDVESRCDGLEAELGVVEVSG
jgi:hypothetical protein